MLGYFVLLKEMFCTAPGRTQPAVFVAAGGTDFGPPAPASPPDFAHGHGSVLQ